MYSGLEVADAGAALVDAYAEAQGSQVGQVVGAFAALGGGEQAEDTAFGRGVFGGAPREAGGGPPRLQGAGQQ